MVEPGKLDWIDISIPIRNGMVHWSSVPSAARKTEAPSPARRLAMARPIPREAPVTIAFVRSNLPMISSPPKVVR